MTTFRKLPRMRPSATANTIRNAGGKSASEGNEAMLDGNQRVRRAIRSKMTDPTRLIEAVLRETPALAVLERTAGAASEPQSIAFRALFAGVSRRLGAAATLGVTAPPGLAALARPHFTLTDWTRLWLTLSALGGTPVGDQPAVVLRI